MSNNNGELKSFGTLLQSLEEGQLHSDLTDKITEITKALQNHVINHGGSPKAALSLKLKFGLKGGANYLIPVRLRFRKDGQKLLWKFLLHRTELIVNHAFDEGCAKVKAETSLPLFIGQSE